MHILQSLESKFDKTYKELISHYKVNPQQTYLEQHVRPLTVKVGQLRSNLREGLIKFFNKNAFELTEIMNPMNQNYQVYY